MLVGLEGDLVRTLQSVKKGIAMLDERRASLTGDGDEVGDAEHLDEYEDAEADEPSRR